MGKAGGDINDKDEGKTGEKKEAEGGPVSGATPATEAKDKSESSLIRRMRADRAARSRGVSLKPGWSRK